MENVTINTLGGSIVTSDSAYSYGVYLRYVKNAELKEISGTISASNNGESDEGVGITQEKATDGTLKIGTLTNTAKVSGYSASGFAVGIAHTAASSAATEIGTLAGTVEAKGQYGSTGLLNAATGTTTQLAATAAYNHISLKADPEAFTWEVTGDIGTAAANSSGAARITFIVEPPPME